MEIREIEAFLVLAEELHFGRTADRLYVSSARVSQLIQALERRIGARVVERTSRAVRLTPVGELLLREAGPAYEHLGQAVATAQAAARQQSGVLRLGVLSTIRTTLPTDLCAAFEARHPGCQAEVRTQIPGDMYGPLRSGEVDALLMRLPAAPDAMPAEPGIVLGPVFALEDRALLMGEDHPLAGRTQVDVEDLADHDVVALTSPFPGYFQDLWVPPVTPRGRPVQRTVMTAGRGRQLDDILDVVARGHLLHVTNANVLDLFPRPGLVTVPLTGLPPFHVVLARRAARSAIVDAFVHTATTLAGTVAAFTADTPSQGPTPGRLAALPSAGPPESHRPHGGESGQTLTAR